MGISAIGGSSAYASSTTTSYGVSSLQSRVTKLDAQIFDISTCTTTPAQQKATQLANLNSQKATAQAQIKALQHQQEDNQVPTFREGGTIHVIA